MQQLQKGLHKSIPCVKKGQNLEEGQNHKITSRDVIMTSYIRNTLQTFQIHIYILLTRIQTQTNIFERT